MTISSDKSLFQSVVKMVDSLSASGNYDAIINILSLLCLFSILNKDAAAKGAGAAVETAQPAAAGVSGANPLQKILGELTKGEGGGLGGALGGALGGPLGGALSAALGSPDMLMSLLPLLNNPQVKSKLNPANIASVMGMIHNLSGAGGNEKQEMPKGKPEKPEKTEKKTPNPQSPSPPQPEPAAPDNQDAKAAKLVEVKTVKSEEAAQPEKTEKKPGTRFLNWKTNF